MIEITGLDEFQRKIEQLRRNAENLDGSHEVSLAELFPPAFMRQHSLLPDIETFCRDSGLDLSSTEAIASTPIESLDAAVKRLTEFPTWHDMKSAGAANWAQRRLFDDVERLGMP
jgi:hypothetical protein